MGVDSNRIIDARVFKLPLFDFAEYVSLIQNPVTILSDDCWEGYAYNRLGLTFTSPLINTYWDRDYYARFIQKPLFYLDTDLGMVREGDVQGGICPIGRLGNNGNFVEIQFVHC